RSAHRSPLRRSAETHESPKNNSNCRSMEHPALLLRRRAAPDYSPRTPLLEAVYLYTYGDLSRSEALSIFSRNDEGFDHFGSVVIAVELIQLGQPEVDRKSVV